MKRNILEYLELSAKNFPKNTAVKDDHQSYSYRELLLLSQRIGSALLNKVNIGEPIGVLAEKSSDTVGVFLGIVQAGAFYILLNPDLPQNRLAQIQSVLKARYWITDKAHQALAEKHMSKTGVLLVEQLRDFPADTEALKHVRIQVIDCDPLYAIFTSGSTGVPKGVVICHRSVLDFIDQFTDLFPVTSSDVIGNQAPFDFDVSVKDIYTAIKTGATLLIIPKPLFSQPARLMDYMCCHGVTIMIWAVSALCLISTCHGLDYRTPDTVRRIMFSGEVMPLKHLHEWMAHLPRTEFVNLYGPTEITCNCTYHRIVRDRDYTKGIPIGIPFPNEHVFLINEDGLIKDPGKTGEICVRGSALALGYFRNSEQTQAAFTQNPLNAWYPERIYRTGDLGVITEEGEIVFCGRKDFQVKYMGHRIELEEIERAVSNIPGIEQCVVVFDEDKKRLFGFYTGNIAEKELHKQLRQFLPVYMVPGVLEQLDAFPLTKNGKTDRRKLLERKKK